jgi:hypothetical protein
MLQKLQEGYPDIHQALLSKFSLVGEFFIGNVPVKD